MARRVEARGAGADHGDAHGRVDHGEGGTYGDGGGTDLNAFAHGGRGGVHREEFARGAWGSSKAQVVA